MHFFHEPAHLCLLSLVLRIATFAIMAVAFIDYSLMLFVEVDVINRAHWKGLKRMDQRKLGKQQQPKVTTTTAQK